MPPKVTAPVPDSPRKPVPVMTTVVPPATGPFDGVRFVMAGAGGVAVVVVVGAAVVVVVGAWLVVVGARVVVVDAAVVVVGASVVGTGGTVVVVFPPPQAASTSTMQSRPATAKPHKTFPRDVTDPHLLVKHVRPYGFSICVHDFR